MMMIMMMMMINSRVCGENSRCPWKTARSKALLVVKTELSLLRSAWPPAESTVTLKITHAEAWNFFCAVFHLTISDYSSHQHWCSRWKLIRGKNSIFSRKRRTKDCFLLTHNLKNKKVSVRDKISSRCAICFPAVKCGPSFAEVSQAISVAKSSQYNVLHNGHIWISQFLSSYPVILTFADTSYLI